MFRDEFLKLESDILALSNPDKRTLKGVRKVFKNELDGEEHAPMVSGKSLRQFMLRLAMAMWSGFLMLLLTGPLIRADGNTSG